MVHREAVNLACDKNSGISAFLCTTALYGPAPCCAAGNSEPLQQPGVIPSRMTIAEFITMDIKKYTLAALLLLASIGSSFAADRINTLEKSGFFSYEPNGIAIRGYDTVAYFTLGMPVEGSDQYSTEWSGATWKFSTQDHLDKFKAAPARFAPQYGGYCAYGVAQESLVKIEPDQWTIIDDKLFLNYNEKLNGKWRQDTAGFISQADALFEKLLKSE